MPKYIPAERVTCADYENGDRGWLCRKSETCDYIGQGMLQHTEIQVRMGQTMGVFVGCSGYKTKPKEDG